MPYRRAAEDEEARLDDEEVAAFQQVIAKKTWRHRGWLSLTLAVLAAGVLALALLLHLRGERPPGPRPGCHIVYVMHVDPVGGHATREEVFECPDAGGLP